MFEKFKPVLMLLIAGFLAGAGIRTAEWMIPKPESRVLICMASDAGTVEVCKNIIELTNKSK